MVQNRIKVMRAEANVSAVAVSERLPDMNKSVMSYIEQGRALPTKEQLAQLCTELNCRVEDIYSLEDIDLRAVADAQREKHPPIKPVAIEIEADGEKVESKDARAGGERHEGMEQLRVWMTMDEKAALVKAVNGLGYRSLAEWLREMYRATIHKYISLGLGSSSAQHDTTPPTTENQVI